MYITKKFNISTYWESNINKFSQCFHRQHHREKASLHANKHGEAGLKCEFIVIFFLLCPSPD